MHVSTNNHINFQLNNLSSTWEILFEFNHREYVQYHTKKRHTILSLITDKNNYKHRKISQSKSLLLKSAYNYYYGFKRESKHYHTMITSS